MRHTLISFFLVVIGSVFFLSYPIGVKAAPCDPPVTNPIPCENSKPGTPQSTWDVNGAGDMNIQGFATDMSVNVGTTVHFKINTPASSYKLDIYRMGYYQGNGARLIATVNPSASLPQTQPACLTESSTGLTDCGNWSESALWTVPSDAVSGIYFAKLTRLDGTTGTSHIVFIVRDNASHSDILLKTSDETWQAYNQYGGKSLYTSDTGGPGTNPARAYRVSYNRPFIMRDLELSVGGSTWAFGTTYPLVRFLERNGYDVSYFSGMDVDRFGSLLTNHKVFISEGHDEYWSGNERTNVEAARGAGVNLAFLSANEMFWKTRYENSIDGTNTPYRTLTSYKETHANAVIDPLDPSIWTGTWRDPRFSPPADGGRPENALTGQIFTVNGGSTNNWSFIIPQADGKMRIWRNTAAANLGSNQSYSTAIYFLGQEVDEPLDNGFRPAGEFYLSTESLAVNAYIQDYGSTYAPGNATHHLSLYRYPSGSLVFGAGSIRYTWALDPNHDVSGPATADPVIQQGTINLFADMGAQPATLMAGMITASQSTDTIAPVSNLTSPSGSTITPNTSISFTGTASDIGGNVGGVEISIDNGVTWHPTAGTRQAWTYQWTSPSSGTVTVRTRAVDDSGNLETPAAGHVYMITNGGSPTPTPSATPVPTPTPTPAPFTTVTFNDLASPNRVLSGAYPTGLITWGSNWWLGGPYGLFTTNSISSTSTSITSTNFSFVSLQRLISIQAYNGGGSASIVTLGCTGNPTVSQTVITGQLVTINTNWSNTCTTVTVTSSNGWNTNFDNIVFDQGGPTPTPTPVPTPTPTPVPTPTPTPSPTPSPTPVPTPTPTPGPITLGNTHMGTILDSGDSNWMNGSKITTGSSGLVVSSLSVYVATLDTSSTNRSYQVAIYSDSSGRPGTRLANSATGTLVANSWNTLPITAALSPTTSYWLMYNSNGRTQSVNSMRFDNGTSGQGAWSNAGVTFGTWPSTFGNSTLAAQNWSIYVSGN